jgi:hypothetical protein
VLDQNLMMAEDMSLVGATGTYTCDRSIDLGAADSVPLLGSGTGGPHDAGLGTTPEVVAQVTTAVDSAGGAATVQAKLIHSDNEDLSSATVLQEGIAIAEATLVKGYQFRFSKIPPGTTKRYLGVSFVTAGEAVTVGKVSAFLALHRDGNFVG